MTEPVFISMIPLWWTTTDCMALLQPPGIMIWTIPVTASAFNTIRDRGTRTPCSYLQVMKRVKNFLLIILNEKKAVMRYAKRGCHAELVSASFLTFLTKKREGQD